MSLDQGRFFNNFTYISVVLITILHRSLFRWHWPNTHTHISITRDLSIWGWYRGGFVNLRSNNIFTLNLEFALLYYMCGSRLASIYIDFGGFLHWNAIVKLTHSNIHLYLHTKKNGIYPSHTQSEIRKVNARDGYIKCQLDAKQTNNTIFYYIRFTTDLFFLCIVIFVGS